MKIFIAGGAGYIGSALVPALLEHGYEVKVQDLCWFGKHLPPEIAFEKKDLFQCTVDDLKGFEQVIFLGGISNDPMAEYSPSKNFIYNAALPAYLALIAKKAGVRRFIHASSCSVYGYTVNELYDEAAPTTCAYPYGISKLQAEQGVHHFEDKSFSVISLRQGTVCGYSPRMRLDLIVNTMFKSAMMDKAITINNPSIWRPILFIKDAGVAFLRAVQADYSLSGIFNVTSDNYTVGHVGDFVKAEIERLTGEKIRLNIKHIQDFRNYKVSIAKARTELGFQPGGSLKDIVDDLFLKRALFSDFENEAYYNVKIFCKMDA